MRRDNPDASRPWARKATGPYTEGMGIPDLLAKIKRLPSEDLIAVEQFVESLRLRKEGDSTAAFTKLSEAAFARLWDNPEDAEYDRL